MIHKLLYLKNWKTIFF